MYFIRLLVLSGLACASLYGDNLLHPGNPVFDRPTLTALGIQLPVSGDDNFNASVSVQFRVSGTQTWRDALPLFRVHPETVAGYTVAPQFGGSIFDLKPATKYDVRLHAVDPDGLDQTWVLTGTTRAVPGDPVYPNIRYVNDEASLTNALATAAPGDVITLANGIYHGTFRLVADGTPDNPIVIRGVSDDGVIVDGGNCVGCNILEVYGAGYVHVERMTMRNADRAIRFQTGGAIGNVVRRVHIVNTTLGIGGRAGQLDSYIADNTLEGRLVWPQVYFDDGGLHADDDGIAVWGSGHVVAHNRISGYGDAMKTSQDGARANDFYGNDVLYTYDNGVELDGSEGNTRALRNRFMNTFATLSVQPVHGGPSYILRNVVVNVMNEQLKFHALAYYPPEEPSGVLVYHNTFVSPPSTELNLQTTATSHYFEIENNLFIAPPYSGPDAVDWTGGIDQGVFDYNGYYPDGIFRFNNPLLGGYFRQANLASLQGVGMEPHGLIAGGPLFASGLTAPNTYLGLMAPADASLAAGSVALDAGRVLPNINDNYQGAGPDLGALERGCPAPVYGPRPAGQDETNEVTGCAVAPQVTTSVSVSPGSAVLAASQSQQFTGTTTPGGGAVSWQITPSRGSISAGGVYTAPADALLGEQVTVQAVSNSNAAISGSAVVRLTAPVTVTLTPAVATMDASRMQQFTASVAGAVDKTLTWSLDPAVGSISASGLYTGPAASNGGIVVVTATSKADPTRSASAAIILPAPPPPSGPVTVTISPATPSVHAGGTLQFNAAVANTTNTRVTWRVSPDTGSISATGLYRAPASVYRATTVTISAQSSANPWIVGIASVVVLP
ncbi:MAG: hypothetical protein ABUS49_00840 [Acidobacteriota bacterium]